MSMRVMKSCVPSPDQNPPQGVSKGRTWTQLSTCLAADLTKAGRNLAFSLSAAQYSSSLMPVHQTGSASQLSELLLDWTAVDGLSTSQQVQKAVCPE